MEVGYRRAALTLYGLAVEDKNWLMEKLPLEQRAKLDELLTQLGVMGLSAESVGDTEHLAGGFDAVQVSAETGSADDSANHLKKIPFPIINKALSQEPAWMVRRILEIHDWGWPPAIAIGGATERTDGSSGNLPQRIELKPRVREAILRGLGVQVADFRKTSGEFEQALGAHYDTGRGCSSRTWKDWIKWKR